MQTRSTRLDWAIFVLLGFAWGSSYLFIKIGVDNGLPTLTLIMLRLGIGLAFLATVVRLAHEPLPREPRILGHLIVMSIVNIVLPFWLITWAENSGIESALASILNATVPLFVIVIAALFLRDEAITVNRLVGLIVGFFGVVILTSRGLGGGQANLAGEIALVLSAVSYAGGAVYAKKHIQGLRPMIPALFQVFFAFVITTVLAFVFERPLDIRPTPEAIFSVIWLGILGSGLAYLLYFRLLARWGATRTSLVAYLLPVYGIILGFLVLKEAIDARLLLGTALVIGGVALVNSRYGTRRLFGRIGDEAPATTK